MGKMLVGRIFLLFIFLRMSTGLTISPCVNNTIRIRCDPLAIKLVYAVYGGSCKREHVCTRRSSHETFDVKTYNATYWGELKAACDGKQRCDSVRAQAYTHAECTNIRGTVQTEYVEIRYSCADPPSTTNMPSTTTTTTTSTTTLGETSRSVMNTTTQFTTTTPAYTTRHVVKEASGARAPNKTGVALLVTAVLLVFATIL